MARDTQDSREMKWKMWWINVDAHVDRAQHMEQQLPKLRQAGITCPIERFSAIVPDRIQPLIPQQGMTTISPPPHDKCRAFGYISHVGRDPLSTFELSCTLSHLEVIRKAHEQDLDFVLVAEDDIVPLTSLPIDWSRLLREWIPAEIAACKLLLNTGHIKLSSSHQLHHQSSPLTQDQQQGNDWHCVQLMAQTATIIHKILWPCWEFKGGPGLVPWVGFPCAGFYVMSRKGIRAIMESYYHPSLYTWSLSAIPPRSPLACLPPADRNALPLPTQIQLLREQQQRDLLRHQARSLREERKEKQEGEPQEDMKNARERVSDNGDDEPEREAEEFAAVADAIMFSSPETYTLTFPFARANLQLVSTLHPDHLYYHILAEQQINRYLCPEEPKEVYPQILAKYLPMSRT